MSANAMYSKRRDEKVYRLYDKADRSTERVLKPDT